MGKSHITDWHPGRVSKEYTKGYEIIKWDKREFGTDDPFMPAPVDDTGHLPTPIDV